MDSGWDPEADDAGSIMEIITGYKSKTIENPSEDESCQFRQVPHTCKVRCAY